MYSLSWFRNAQRFRRLVNLWPPMWGAGIAIAEVSDDWMYVRARMKLNFLNRNFVGTQYGGSLFSMTDPFYMLMLLHHIGDDHYVWDSSAEIQFIKPGKTPVTAEFILSEERLAAIRSAAAAKKKHFEPFVIDIRDTEGDTVARVDRTIYVRRKPHKFPDHDSHVAGMTDSIEEDP